MSALRHKYSKASNRKFVKYVMVLIIKNCLKQKMKLVLKPPS